MGRSINGSAGLRAMGLAAALACGTGSVIAQTGSAAVPAQTPSQGAPRQTGTVKEVHEHDFVLTTAGGEFAVNVPEGSHILIVPPGSKSLSAATPGAMKDIAAGDRALVTGTSGDSGVALSATRVVLMKSDALAATHAAESSAWAQGTGGIVKSVSGPAITISSGMKTVTVQTTPSTIVRRYAPGSVNFADATGSTITAIEPGDQLRVRGAKSPDGATVTADEIVSGNFKNYSGTIASIDPASTTITLKDLTTKKTVSVAVTSSSDVRRLPPQMATMMAARMRGGQPGQGAEATGGRAGGAGGTSGGAQGGGGQYGGGGQGGGRAAGADLSRMLSRLPTETLGGLKQGDAVMIVATAPAADAGDKATAITLLVGVDAILAAPAGQSTTLSPWSVGSEGEMATGMSGGPQ